MDGFTPATAFGPEVAAHYDDEPRGDEEAAVRFLAAQAGNGRALELAIGTGRIALPLSRHCRVDGVELSAAMVERLREKPGGAELKVVRGDMAHDEVDGPYELIYVVFNSLFNLLTQDDQVACLATAARQLTDDGVFVVEAAPPWAWVVPGQAGYLRPERVTAASVHLDVATYDPVTQLLNENHVRLDTGGVHLDPVCCRVAGPAELNLMARLAGLRLRTRHGGWQGEPFTADSTVHVSVYERAHP